MSLTEKQILTKLQVLLDKGGSDYRAILKLSSELSKLDPNFQRFFIDAKTLIHLGRESIKDHTTALIELVKNSYDADANNVDVEILCSNNSDIIRIADNGFGMTKEQLLNNWLRIGFSNKRHSKMSGLGRRKTGEKGIGRISADRLGAKLELISKTESDGIVGLKVNWDDFDIDGKDVSDIDVELTTPLEIRIPLANEKISKTGTEIRITNLRQPWTPDNIENLYNELATLTPPFKDVSDFSINLINDIAPDFSRPVNSKYYEASEIDVSVVFDGTDEVYYSIKDKYSKKEVTDTITLQQFYSKKQLKCGPIEVRLLFFLRESSSVVGTDFRLSDLREFLDNNYGVKIYRDNIAVKPYGFPKAQLGFDWLKIGEEKAKNPAGIGRGNEYTVSPNQLVGAIFITRDNNEILKDSAAREGLVENEGFEDMKEFVLASKRLLEAHRASIYPKIEKARNEKQKIPAHREAEKIKDQLTSVKDELNSIRTEIEAGEDNIKPVAFLKPIARSIDKVESISEDVENTITELLNWQRVLNGLATIGISSAVFGHETEGSITQFQGSTTTAIKLMKLSPPKLEKALGELDKALKSSRKVAAWGAYALTRVQKEKRRKRNVQIFKTIEAVIKELKPAFEASSISLSLKGENLYSKTYQMDIETILVNLLTNAYTAAILKGGERKVLVKVDREDLDEISGYCFSVADTGHGVPKEFEKQIFDPLFSTKTTGTHESKSVGTGLGLTIVKSMVEELEGKIYFSKDTELKGANFKIWLPKIQ
ncbi:sensor histidine kinase [Ferruginibacter sp.]|nr:sensor histidine kinase [Ferruginibacter sp.]